MHPLFQDFASVSALIKRITCHPCSNLVTHVLFFFFLPADTREWARIVFLWPMEENPIWVHVRKTKTTVEEPPIAMVSMGKPIDSGPDQRHLPAKTIISHNSLFPIHFNPKITHLQRPTRITTITRVALEEIFFCTGGKRRGPEFLGLRIERWQMRHHLRQNRRSRFTEGCHLGWRRERHRRPCHLLPCFLLIIGL